MTARHRTFPIPPMQVWTQVLVLVFVVAVGVWSGCGARKEYVVDEVRIHRVGWDTLEVEVAFAWSTAVGGSRSAEPSEISVIVFDSDYDTLYYGPPGRIAVPDRKLADREKMTLELCGAFEEQVLCAQQVERASPKRVTVEPDIEYPIAGDYDEGRYQLDFRVERQRFGEAGWEPIQNVPQITGYLLAWVGEQEQEAVRIPFRGGSGAFDLTRYDNYRDFKYYLESALLDEMQAEVSFDVYGGMKGQVARLASTRRAVHVKTDEERVEEVRQYVRQATVKIVDELDAFLGGRGAVAYVGDWSYDAVSRTYLIEVEVEWRGSVFDGRRLVLAGELRVAEDGETASFQRRDGNRRALRRWDDRVSGDVLQLGQLEAPVEQSREDEHHLHQNSW